MSDDLSGVRPPNFSQRFGYEPYPPPLQLDDLDERTRTDLWNFVYIFYLNPLQELASREGIWTDFLVKFQNRYTSALLTSFLQELVENKRFNQVLDLIEYLMQKTDHTVPEYELLAQHLNNLLAKNRVGYRLNAAEALVIAITDEHELESIQDAANSALSEVRLHLRAAVQLFADRDNPQWAKSMNESILAVEAAAREVAGKPAATLEKALDEIQRSGNTDLHPPPPSGEEVSDFGPQRRAARRPCESLRIAQSQN
jgi:hypothetical protein